MRRKGGGGRRERREERKEEGTSVVKYDVDIVLLVWLDKDG